MRIMRAIAQARKKVVDRNPADFEFLMSRWSTETHTFGPTLEDVAILASLPIFGEA